MHVSAGLKQRKPANQKVQSDSPPRPVTTFPLLSHIFGGSNLSPRVEQKFYSITNKYRHDFRSKGCFTKDGLGFRVGVWWEILQKLVICRPPRASLRFPVVPCQRERAWTLQAQLLRPYQGHPVPSPQLLGSGVASKRLKWMEENFKVSQLFLSFPAWQYTVSFVY